MTARFLVPKGYFSRSTFTSFHKLVHDLMLCRDCGAFADWPAGQKICKECCQVRCPTRLQTPPKPMYWATLCTANMRQRSRDSDNGSPPFHRQIHPSDMAYNCCASPGDVHACRWSCNLPQRCWCACDTGL